MPKAALATVLVSALVVAILVVAMRARRRPTGATAAHAASSSVFTAMVFLNPGADVSSERVRTAFAEQWPTAPRPAPVEADAGNLAFRVGDDDVVVGRMGASVPWSSLEDLCRTSWLWKDAEADLRAHSDHLVVAVLGLGGALGRCRRLTQVCAAILASCPEASGVLWPNAPLLVPSALFQAMARELLPVGTPVHLWVDVRVEPSVSGGSRGFTLGMAALGHMDIEADRSPEAPGALRERILGLAGYVIDRGEDIPDGDTVGNDATERIRVVHAPSVFGREATVMRLEY